jgi:hypothetical protein
MTPFRQWMDLRTFAVFSTLLTSAAGIKTAQSQGVYTVYAAQEGDRAPAPIAPRPNAVMALEADGSRWRFSARGKYRLVSDPRGLLQVYHPWDAAEAGEGPQPRADGGSENLA